MPFNLLIEKWICVERSSGGYEWITPYQITDRFHEDPVQELASPRPDFNGALLQFLIALVQTAFAPQDRRIWRQLLRTPPPPTELQSAFAKWESAFNLDGDGPRFMQDLESDLESGSDQVPINRLLISEPGEQSEKLNKDHFIKRSTDAFMSLPAAAMALMCLQMNAPSGGQGHRTSLRGGGPLTTVVRGKSLWEEVWSNVVEPDKLDYSPESSQSSSALFLPWMAPTKTSENDEKIEPTETHPLLSFWACPRRIRLKFADSSRRCDVFSSLEVARGCPSYVTKNYGNNYSENWIHPLTPYRKNKDGQSVFSVKTPAGGLSFQHWLGLISHNNGALPALVIQRLQGENQIGAIRIRCFGYAMDNMKPLNWVESEFPLYVFDELEKAQRYAADLNSLVLAAREIWGLLRKSIQQAQPDQAPLSSTKGLEKLERQFNNSLESRFFSLAGELTQISDASRTEAKRNWLTFLHATAFVTFDAALVSGDVTGLDHPRVFGGRAYLGALLRKGQTKVESILELPLSELGVSKEKTANNKQEMREITV
jgi:CRISPR system Cascade subunit CasA